MSEYQDAQAVTGMEQIVYTLRMTKTHATVSTQQNLALA